MKKVFLLLVTVLVFSAFAGLAADEVTAATGINIACENGKIVVSGSFDGGSAVGETYTVVLEAYDYDYGTAAKGELLKTFESTEATAIVEGTNEFSLEADAIANILPVKAYIRTSGGTTVCDAKEDTIRSLKVLAVGNSFSVDGMQWVYQIATDLGIDNIVLGNMYRAGWTLNGHYDCAANDKGYYTYYKNTTGTWTSVGAPSTNEATDGYTMLQCIEDEDWNLITFQQASGSSGVASTYSNLGNLINYVNTNKTNPYCKLAWHMTWAYAKTSTHNEYVKYNNDQMTMYNAIVDVVQNTVLANYSDKIEFVIPSGTTIQNARTSFMDDTDMTRDGYHLSYSFGRYAAGLAWVHKITGLSIDDVDFIPSNACYFQEPQREIAKESAKNAVRTPFAVTQSSYADITALYIPRDYEQIGWDQLGSSYYSSGSVTTGATNSPYYISSKKFTRETLPIGSILVVDPGYKYRVVGWNSSYVHGEVVAARYHFVTEKWWDDYTQRAFNFCYGDGTTTDLSGIVDESSRHLRIYVPKGSMR